ncbi:MAG: Lrp/AsnC family transcriptional regulator [Candidatus Omnitrophica bacterium]|nr:Lrp/AsnC family transcriptional regulator [Candidatus Omnitrophota bacterium]
MTPLRPQDLDALDRRLLTLAQKEIPLVERPYRAFGESLGISSEAETLSRVERLKKGHILRQIGAIFDTRRLGYQSSLVAVRVPKERLDAAAAVVNEHPGVSHNYGRNHAYNLWYTIALPPGVSMERTIQRLHELCGGQVTRPMPTLRLFKIGVQLDVAGDSKLSDETDGAATWAWKTPPLAADLNERDVRAIRALQEDLPLDPAPFEGLGRQEGLSGEEILQGAHRFLRDGIMRRYSAVLHHRAAGFVVNGMAVWKVPPERIEELGPQMGGFRGVTHCYQRPTYEDWPYTVFTMIHARTGPECKGVVDAITAKTGLTEVEILYSTKEYKKVRVKYFTTELKKWEQKYGMTDHPEPVEGCIGHGSTGSP